MKESIEEIFLDIVQISKSYHGIDLKIIEKTKSILKTRLYFSEELFIQIYINIKRTKRSYALILNDYRIFGKDHIFGQWHLHSFENSDKHDNSKNSEEPVSLEEFIKEAFFIVSEKIKII